MRVCSGIGGISVPGMYLDMYDHVAHADVSLWYRILTTQKEAFADMLQLLTISQVRRLIKRACPHPADRRRRRRTRAQAW